MSLKLIEAELIEAEVVEVDWRSSPTDRLLEDSKIKLLELEDRLQFKTKETRKRQGEILLEVKESVPHGKFTMWLESMGLKARTARNYMAAVKEHEEIPPTPLKKGGLEAKSVNLAVLEEGQAALVDARAELDYLRSEEFETDLVEECLPILEAIAETGTPKPQTFDFINIRKDLWDTCMGMAIAALDYRNQYIAEVGSKTDCKVACAFNVAAQQFADERLEVESATN